MSVSIAYRPELDGLRAIAVLAVMAHHAELDAVPGGFTGVDIFFVLSGYLISAIILGNIERGTFGYRAFYLRRALRILPAMLFVTLITLVASLLVIDPANIKTTAQSAIASVAMLANVYFWLRSGGYFGLAAPYIPLIHLWSLAVEEQFYLIVTPALVLMSRRSLRDKGIVLGLAALCSFLLCCYLSIAKPGANYFLLPTRGWEFLAGMLVLLGERAAAGRLCSKAGPWLAAAGLAMLAAPIFLLSSAIPFPGVAAVPTIVGTCLFIAFAEQDRGVGRILSCWPLVAIGLISYSTYLWHQPLLAMFRLLSPDELTVASAAAVLVLSVLLGAATWRFIEMPFRGGGRFQMPKLAAIVAALLVIIATGSLLAFGKQPVSLTVRQQYLVQFADPYIAFNQRCRTDENPDRPLGRGCRIGAPVRPSVAIVGDSYATGASAAFAGPLKTAGLNALILTASGCLPLWIERGTSDPAAATCDRYSAAALDHVIARPDLQTVILVARWSLYAGSDGADGIYAADPGRRVRTALLQRALNDTVNRLLSAGRHVIIVYPSPAARRDIPRYLLKRERLGWQIPQQLTIPRSAFDAANQKLFALLDRLGEHPRLTRLYPARGLCPADLAGRCLVVKSGRPLYFDDNHLSAEGAQLALPPDLIGSVLGRTSADWAPDRPR